MRNLLLLLFTMTLIGCGSDDSSDTINQQRLVGRWNHSHKTIDGGTAVPYENTCETLRDHWDILEDHTILHNHYGNACQMGNSFTGNWSLNQNSLSVWSTFDPALTDETFTVISLEDDKLQLQHVVETPDGDVVERLYFDRQ